MLYRPITATCVLAAAAATVIYVGSGCSSSSSSSGPETGNAFARRDLVSDGAVTAEHVDSALVNAWGIAASASGPWWVSAAETGFSLLYDGEGIKQSLAVKVPGTPTGAVFNGGPNFMIPPAAPTGSALFLFASEDGTISAWSPTLMPPDQAIVVVNNTASGAIYKGLAIDSTTAGTRLYATDFHNAKVDVFDLSFNPVSLPAGFVDPTLPAGYAPFGIQTLAGRVFVAYAKQDSDAKDEVDGGGNGFVEKYDFDGALVARVASRGDLNAPWGMAVAPADFGKFGGDILVGNFGDGKINVFDPVTFALKGHLKDEKGKTIVVDRLWGLAFGNGGNSGPTNVLFFAAGPLEEKHGLFGRLDPQ